MRYSQAADEAETLLRTDAFRNGTYSLAERNEILDKLEQDISGHVLEDIVLYQAIQSAKFELQTRSYNGLEMELLVAVRTCRKSICLIREFYKERNVRRFRNIKNSVDILTKAAGKRYINN